MTSVTETMKIKRLFYFYEFLAHLLPLGGWSVTPGIQFVTPQPIGSYPSFFPLNYRNISHLN